MTWIKICGTTNLEDARAAIGAGADAVGFVFGPSKRQVTSEQAARITAELPMQIERVGVFVNELIDRVREIVDEACLNTVQLQGDETLEYVRDLSRGRNGDRREHALRIVKTLWVGPTLEDRLREFGPGSGVDAILFDSGSPQERGGTGRTFSWPHVAALLGKQKIPIIVAGGLNAENVAEAMATLHPWGVDVASGTESAPGKKDPLKIKAFVAAVRDADKKL